MTDEMDRLEELYRQQAADFARERAQWELTEFHRQELIRGFSRKVRAQTKVINRLEAKLAKPEQTITVGETSTYPYRFNDQDVLIRESAKATPIANMVDMAMSTNRNRVFNRGGEIWFEVEPDQFAKANSWETAILLHKQHEGHTRWFHHELTDHGNQALTDVTNQYPRKEAS